MAKSRKKVKRKIVKKADRKADKKGISVISEKPEKPEEPKPKPKPKITEYPAAGAKVTEFENALDAQLAGDKPKRPVGRPPKPPESEPPELTLDVVAGVIKIPFELWGIGQGEKLLALTDDEAKQIAEPARQLLEHYLPKIPIIAYAWLSLSVSTFWVMRTRLLLIQDLRKIREKKQPPKSAAPAQPGVTTKFPAEIKPEKV